MIDECEIMVTSFYIIEWMGAGYVCYLDIIASIIIVTGVEREV